jgi:hypothetical protein
MLEKQTNNLLYSTIHDKYFECTERERRSIARSDAEFCMMIRSVITKLSGLGYNEREAFGNIVNLEIPRIPRGMKCCGILEAIRCQKLQKGLME